MKKNIWAVLVYIILFIGINSVCYAATTDNNAPVVNSIVLDKTDVTVGDAITITVNATDESNIALGSAETFVKFKNNNYETPWIYFLQKSDDLYTGTFSITNDWINGEYTISYFHISDEFGNAASSYSIHSDIINSVKFTVSGAVDMTDTTAPAIRSISIDKKSVSAGDTITITIDIEDESDLKVGSLFYMQFANDGVTSNSLHFRKNDDEKYTASLEITDSFVNGTYCVSAFNVSDTFGNTSTMYSLGKEIFSDIFFEVTGCVDDSAPPVIQSLSVDKHEGFVGDSITISMKLQDASPIKSRNYICFTNSSTNKYLYFDEMEDGSFQTVLKIDGTFSTGLYKLFYVSISDIYGNSDLPQNVNGIYDEIYFYVCGLEHNYVESNVIKAATCAETGIKENTCEYCTKQKTEVVPIDKTNHVGRGIVYTESATISNITIDDDVYIAAGCVTTIDGTVTITGDVYVYGALVNHGIMNINGCLNAVGISYSSSGMPSISTNGYYYPMGTANLGSMICSSNMTYETIEERMNCLETIVAVPASCKKDGSTEASRCKMCGEYVIVPKVVQATGHTDENGVEENKVEETCTNAGSYDLVVYCAVCMEELSRERKEIPATGHTWDTDYTEDKTATCTEAGRESVHCKKCDAIKNEKELPATGHKYGDWQTVTEPTCTNKGLQERNCTVCDIVDKAELQTTGHTDENAVEENRNEETCTNAGSYDSVVYCAVCKEELSRERKEIPATGHVWDTDYTEDKAATCTEAGNKSIHCRNCDVIKDEQVLAAIGHNAVTDTAKPATCIADGKTEGSHCSACDFVIKEQAIIPAIGHKSIIDKAMVATCTVAGKTEGVHCSVCGAVLKQQVMIDAVGHSWDSGKVTTEPTYTTEGIKNFTCSVCGETKTETIAKIGLPASGTILKTSSAQFIITDVSGTVEYAKPLESASSISIPATVSIGGVIYKVTSVANNAFKNNSKLTTIKIGQNITTIGNNAFYGCKKLKTVTIDSNVTTIGAGAFQKCTALKKITIPAKVTTIGKNAFNGDKKLSLIIVKSKELNLKSVGGGALKRINSKAVVKVPSGKAKTYKSIFMRVGLTGKKQKVMSQ